MLFLHPRHVFFSPGGGLTVVTEQLMGAVHGLKVMSQTWN